MSRPSAHCKGYRILPHCDAGSGSLLLHRSRKIGAIAHMVALAETLANELPVQRIDLDATIRSKAFFDLDTYRQPESYRRITEYPAAGPPVRPPVVAMDRASCLG
jgi:hypothetical protein